VDDRFQTNRCHNVTSAESFFRSILLLVTRPLNPADAEPDSIEIEPNPSDASDPDPTNAESDPTEEVASDPDSDATDPATGAASGKEADQISSTGNSEITVQVMILLLAAPIMF
jgi:hypothetical protein